MIDKQKALYFVVGVLIGMATAKAITDDKNKRESDKFANQMKVMDDAIAEMNARLKASNDDLNEVIKNII